MRRAMLLVIVAAVLLPVLMPVPAAAASGADVLSRVQHIVVIYQRPATRTPPRSPARSTPSTRLRSTAAACRRTLR